MLEFVMHTVELAITSWVHPQPFSPNTYPVKRESFSDGSIKLTFGAETAGGYADG